MFDSLAALITDLHADASAGAGVGCASTAVDPHAVDPYMVPPDSVPDVVPPDSVPGVLLPGVDPDGPSPDLDVSEALVDEIVELERAKAMIEARVMRLIADLSDRADGWIDQRDMRMSDRLGADSLAAAELAPALHLAPVTAGMRVERALRMRDQLPATLGVMAHGDLDLGRVLAIDEATRVLSVDAAQRVERMVLPKAVDQTAAELRAALRKAVIAVDPDGAEERRKAAVKGRRVSRYQREDGMSAFEAVLSAIDTGEVYDVVEEMARRMKTADDPRSMDARRADAFVWLVLGRDPHLGPEDIGRPPDIDPDDPDDPAEPPAHPSAWTPGCGDDSLPDEPDEPDDLDERFPPEPPEHGDESDPTTGASSRGRGSSDQPVNEDGRGRHESGRDEPRDGESSDGESSEDQSVHQIDQVVGEGDTPGEDGAGWSQWPDAPEAARRDGELTRFDRARDARRTRISELAVLSLSAMTCRHPQQLRWVAINTVIRPGGATVRIGELEGYGPITSHAADHLVAAGAAQPPSPPSGREPTPTQAERHDPPGWLDTETRARDGTCRFPGCRVSAFRADVDHTIPHPRGKTVRDNIGALCRGHHRLKQAGTWRVSQDTAGSYTWTSTITGRRYTTYPRGTTGNWTGATTTELTFDDSVRTSSARSGSCSLMPFNHGDDD